MHKRNYPAKAKYDIISPVLNGQLPIQVVTVQHGLSRRTLKRSFMICGNRQNLEFSHDGK